jgi:hypothetical protein
MTTIARFDRPGLLERLTNSTAFAVLFGMASLVLAPSVLMGLFVLPALFVPAARASSEVWMWLLLSVGGVLGYVGLFRARRPSSSSADYRATLTCLGIGIATGATVVGKLVDSTMFDDAFTAGAAVVPAIAIVAALGRVARLRRLRASAAGRVPDSLPLIFLSIALAEALCAIAVGVQLACLG